MKNIINKITGKKALTIVTVIACICTVLEIATAIRTGNKIDFFCMGGMFAAITVSGWYRCALVMSRASSVHGTLDITRVYRCHIDKAVKFKNEFAKNY